MRYRILLLALLLPLLMGCSSKFLEALSEEDLSECEVIDKRFYLSVKFTPMPVYLAGRWGATLWTARPSVWGDFAGEIYLKEMEWNVDWIVSGSAVLGGYTIAKLDDGRWTARPALDIVPYIEEEQGQLKVRLTLRGQGLKPSAEFLVIVKTSLYICGSGSRELADYYR